MVFTQKPAKESQSFLSKFFAKIVLDIWVQEIDRLEASPLATQTSQYDIIGSDNGVLGGYKMDFGMPTLIELETLSETVEVCASLGLKFIELNMNMPQYQLGSLSKATICGYQNRAIYFTVHLDENLNVWDFNPLVSEAYMETALATIELAKEANIPILNMHMNNGVYFTLPDSKVYLFDRYKNEFIAKTRLFRQECETAIGSSKLKICIENCDGYTDFQLEAIKYLLQSHVFGLTMDIGHNHSANRQDEPFIMQHEKHLCHLHIHDAISSKNHLALGDGDIDIQEKLWLANEHHCRCVLETKTVEGLKRSVAFLRNNYSRYWD